MIVSRKILGVERRNFTRIIPAHIQTLPRKMITQENDKFEWRNNKKTNLENDNPGK